MSNKIKWHGFTRGLIGQELPKERKLVLVTGAHIDSNYTNPVMVGYLRIWSDGPFFVTPGGTDLKEVTHWCDCLPDNFEYLVQHVKMHVVNINLKESGN